MNIFRASSYFESQRVGRWRWPWLLLGLLTAVITLIVAILICVLLVWVIGKWTNIDFVDEVLDLAKGQTNTTNTMTIMMALLAVGIACWAAAMAGSSVQGRSIRSLLTPMLSFRWGLVGRAVLLLLALEFLWVFIPFEVDCSAEVALEFTGLRMVHAIYFVPFLLCILLQTSGEDVFFKGYLLRQFGAVVPVFWLAPMVVVAVFVCMHAGNPDFEADLAAAMTTFFMSELLAVYLLMRTGGMEVPLVLHFFNNAKIFLFIADKDTQANDLTLWVYESDAEEVISELSWYVEFFVPVLIYYGLILLAFCWRRSPFYLSPFVKSDALDQRLAIE